MLRICPVILLIATLNFVFTKPVTAQTLHTFSPTGELSTFFQSNSDGFLPLGGLIEVGGTLYGTTSSGGFYGTGTIFAVNTDGTGFTNLHNFSVAGGSVNPFVLSGIIYSNSDGGNPESSLVLSGDMLYGTTRTGGGSTAGGVFAIHTDGSGFTNLYFFTGGNDGSGPKCGLIVAGNTLYGTTRAGGTSGKGTIFSINTDGTSFTNLHNFTGTNDGANPYAKLLLAGNFLYGTTASGGTSNSGTIFGLNTDGTGFTNLYNFRSTLAFTTYGSYPLTNSPYSELILSGDTLYGTASAVPGSPGTGMIFAIKTNGTGFTNMFSIASNQGDGSSFPYAGIILWNNLLVGIAPGGADFAGPPAGSGPSGATIFSVHKDGTHIAVFGSFIVPQYGDNGHSTPLLSTGGKLYTANASVIAITVAPRLSINASSNNIILSWPTNTLNVIDPVAIAIVSLYDTAELQLQSATNQNSPASWNPVLSAPVAINGQYVVTNAITSSPTFYRLTK